MEKEISTQEVLGAINNFSDRVDEHFDGVEKRLDGVEKRLDGVEKRLDGVEKRLDGVEKRLDGVEKEMEGLGAKQNKMAAVMVTKDYLDDKLADLRGDIVVIIRGEDIKIKTLVEILRERKVITLEDEKKILSLGPFPKLYL